MADSIKFKFEFFLQPDVEYETATASELTWGRLLLTFDDGNTVTTAWDFAWSWVELLEYFSQCWRFLFNKEATIGNYEDDKLRMWNEALCGVWPSTKIYAWRWNYGHFLVALDSGETYHSAGEEFPIHKRFVIPSYPFFIEVGHAMDQIANRLRDSNNPRSIDAIKAWDAVKIDF